MVSLVLYVFGSSSLFHCRECLSKTFFFSFQKVRLAIYLGDLTILADAYMYCAQELV